MDVFPINELEEGLGGIFDTVEPGALSDERVELDDHT